VTPRRAQVDLHPGRGGQDQLDLIVELLSGLGQDGHAQPHLVDAQALVVEQAHRLLHVQERLLLLRIGGLVAAAAAHVGPQLVVGELQGAQRPVGADGPHVHRQVQREGQRQEVDGRRKAELAPQVVGVEQGDVWPTRTPLRWIKVVDRLVVWTPEQGGQV
jgi:hypothetical protein